MKFSNSKIKFNRGDDDSLMVGLTDGCTFKEGDKVFFSLKILPSDEVDVFQIESTNFVPYLEVENAGVLIDISHEFTIDLELGDYYYDILIQWADGEYLTVVKPTSFTLIPGGSHTTTPGDPDDSL